MCIHKNSSVYNNKHAPLSRIVNCRKTCPKLQKLHASQNFFEKNIQIYQKLPPINLQIIWNKWIRQIISNILGYIFLFLIYEALTLANNRIFLSSSRPGRHERVLEKTQLRILRKGSRQQQPNDKWLNWGKLNGTHQTSDDYRNIPISVIR